VAKSVIFGVAYGRAAKAIALAVREQKVEISENEAQQVIDALFAQYTKLKPYFEACCARATQVRWLCNCYGRFRRFPEVEDSKAAGEFERQSMNFPIQSTIASSLNRGVSALYSEREAMYQEFGEKPFLFCLTIHDAVLIQAKAKYVDRLINGGVIERAMCKTHPIYPADLAGMPLKGGPYYLGLDFEVSEYWSEPLSESRSIELGVPTKFA
jgi:DNA polymerase I-like protein with 3'-5' exonuclease and polymerase domains